MLKELSVSMLNTLMIPVPAALLFWLAAFLTMSPGNAVAGDIGKVLPVLEFPEIGLDDPATYQGYTTRFFRDSRGNVLQIYIKQYNGRLVNLWADAVNESISFTARDDEGNPAALTWQSSGAKVWESGQTRFVEYTLTAPSNILEIGHFLLGSMRKERDFQYFKRHLQPYNSEPFIENELTELIGLLEKMPEDIRARHLKLLNAGSIDELRSRLTPVMTFREDDTSQVARISQTTFDGKNHLLLEIRVNPARADLTVREYRLTIRSTHGSPVTASVTVATDSPPLHPLTRQEIFNNDFFRFYEAVKSEQAKDDPGTLIRFRRLERQVKSMELMCTREKLFAGLPNYATYFGRDMMMSALMLEPVVKPAILEHVISSVLKKLTPSGEVSHEEGLGGQAIKENAARYNRLMKQYLQAENDGGEAERSNLLTSAQAILRDLQRITENYMMMDDDFQLPVLAAHYLGRADISIAQKRKFLLEPLAGDNTPPRLTYLLRNLIYVAKISAPYATNPVPGNLVSFRKLGEHRWHSGSWRDSGVGYAGGRFAMDINVIWVPQALKSLQKILSVLDEAGINLKDAQQSMKGFSQTKLSEYMQQPEKLEQALATWSRAEQHFAVHLNAREVQKRIAAKLAWLPGEERDYWQTILSQTHAADHDISFLALSLDENGSPLPLPNTDVATRLFLEDFTAKIVHKVMNASDVIQRLKIVVTPYPVGLFIEGVGPVVVNDAYASPEVWEGFRKDFYHSPRVIWGREVNLFVLGLIRQILAASSDGGKPVPGIPATYLEKLNAMLWKTVSAVEASGLKHSELWTYRIEDGVLKPARYPTSTDIQLWNLTDLSVQYFLHRMGRFH